MLTVLLTSDDDMCDAGLTFALSNEAGENVAYVREKAMAKTLAEAPAMAALLRECVDAMRQYFMVRAEEQVAEKIDALLARLDGAK